jgi:hypothetical protein
MGMKASKFQIAKQRACGVDCRARQGEPALIGALAKASAGGPVVCGPGEP